MTLRPKPDPPYREVVNTTPSPPTGLTTIICTTCGGHYLDISIGHDSHKVVHGHHPTPPRKAVEQA